MTKLTCNQVMVLLDCGRGTFKSERHMSTWLRSLTISLMTVFRDGVHYIIRVDYTVGWFKRWFLSCRPGILEFYGHREMWPELSRCSKGRFVFNVGPVSW